tara:strand:+ start:24470 stop:25510 length:1041 start_codon:yes stop_codon:yes gene_type:complete
MKNRNKTILITGGGGYIGSELSKYLLKKKYNIIILDRFYFNNNPSFIKNKNVKIVKGDNRNIDNNIFKKVSTVIDLVSLGIAPSGSNAYDKYTNEINFESRFKNAKKSKKFGVKRYIFPSSCSVYGFQNSKICNEASKLNPQSSYAKSKIKCEKNILPLGDKNFTVTALRLPTVFGVSERMRFDIIVNAMTFDALENKKIKLLRNGKQRRPFVHIKDVCRAFHFFINKDVNLINNQIINIGDESNNINLIDLVSLIFKTLKIKKKIEWYGAKDDRSYFVSYSKMRQLGFKCLYNLDYGINEIHKNYNLGLLRKSTDTISLKWFDELMKWNEIIEKIKLNNYILKNK